jgi:hypothetical protein
VLEKFRVSLIGADRGSLGRMKIHSVFVLLRLVNLTPLVFRFPGSGVPRFRLLGIAVAIGIGVSFAGRQTLFFRCGQDCLKVRGLFLPCDNPDFNFPEPGIFKPPVEIAFRKT